MLHRLALAAWWPCFRPPEREIAPSGLPDNLRTYSSPSGATALGYQHLLDNHAVIHDQIAANHAVLCDRVAGLDTASLAAQADHNGSKISALATQAEADAKVAAAAAELTVQAEPLLAAIREQGAAAQQHREQLQKMQAQLDSNFDAIQAQQCTCTVM